MDEAEQRRHRAVVTALVNNPSSFYMEARSQLVCAVCEKGGDFHAHHVIPKNFLRRNHKPLHDTRCALRLCEGDHMSYTWGGVNRLVIATAKLKLVNICYVFDTFGPDADWLLTRHYTGPDERWFAHLREECPECQSPISLPT